MDNLVYMHSTAVQALRSAQKYEREALHALQEACANIVDADHRIKVEGLRNSCREMFGLTDTLLKSISSDCEKFKKQMSEPASDQIEAVEECLAA